MSFHFSPALVAGSSPATYSASEPYAPWKSNRTAGKSSCGARGTACCHCSRSGTTPEPSTAALGMDSWISSLRASRASHSPSPGADGEATTSETCGPRPSESFARYDRASHSWRTSQGFLAAMGTSDTFSGTWPKQGSMRNGAVFPRLPLERPTEDDGSGFLPTPNSSGWTSNIGGAGGRVGKVRPSLEMMARKNLWPTPSVPNGGRKPKGGMSPTGMTPDGKKRQVGLENAVKLLSEMVGGTLNPTWVEWLMGWPIGWTGLQPLVMDRFREWRRKHSGD